MDELNMCIICGSVVADKDQHDQWHDKINQIENHLAALGESSGSFGW